MKTTITILAAFALLNITALAQVPTPPAATALAQPPPRLVLSAPILSPADAVAYIAAVSAAGNTVSVSGSTVRVFPPNGTLITSGSQSGMIRVFLMPTGR